MDKEEEKMENENKVEELIDNLEGFKIEDIAFGDAARISEYDSDEGIVFLGAGGDPKEWINGISDILLKEGIATGTKHSMWKDKFYKMTSTGGRTDLLMLFKNKTTINVGKMAIWRLKFGDTSWLSDFIINYKKHY